MSSFPVRARQAVDPDLPVRQRLFALKDCVKGFSFYGGAATWHHVITWARVPQRLEDDLDSLGRAVAELAAARELWLPLRVAYARRRVVEKALGWRQQDKRDLWLTAREFRAYCPNPHLRPSGSMASVVGRVIAAHQRGTWLGPECAVCGASRAVEVACPGCGVHVLGYGR